MREYVKFIEVGPSEVFQYLEKGWEIIDKTKAYIPDEITQMTFQLGYPAHKMIEDLLKIINDYEKHGLKEKLFELVASENGESAGGFSTPYLGADENSKTIQYMLWYESAVKS